MQDIEHDTRLRRSPVIEKRLVLLILLEVVLIRNPEIEAFVLIDPVVTEESEPVPTIGIGAIMAFLI